jgi:hypothetical protein
LFLNGVLPTSTLSIKIAAAVATCKFYSCLDPDTIVAQPPKKAKAIK